MGKRILITVVILLILGLAIMGYFLHLGRKDLFTDPYKAISPNACIVIETVDLKSFMNSLTTGRGLFGEIGKIRELEKINRNLKYFADLLNKENFKELFNEGKATISFHPDSNGGIVPMLSMPVPGEIKLRHIKEMLNSSGIKGINDYRLDGNPMLGIPIIDNGRKDTAYISLISGLIVSANSKSIVKGAYIQADKVNDIRNVPGFSRVLLASGKNADKIFVVFPNLPDLLQPLLINGSKEFTEKVARLAGTAEGDIYISEDGLILNGYTESTDTSELLYKYKVFPSGDFHTYKILPSSTILLKR